jgi:hypothetical protein
MVTENKIKLMHMSVTKRACISCFLVSTAQILAYHHANLPQRVMEGKLRVKRQSSQSFLFLVSTDISNSHSYYQPKSQS